MSLATVLSRASLGITAPPVQVEVHITGGLPKFAIVGLPEATVRESKDRVRSAIINSRFEFPKRRITVNLAPAELPKDGSRFDLPIAVGILAATGQLCHDRLHEHELIGELALDGGLRRSGGSLPAALRVRDADRIRLRNRFARKEIDWIECRSASFHCAPMPSASPSGRARFPSLAASLCGPHVACGYGRVSRNCRDRHQPLAQVVFRSLPRDGSSGAFARRSVALTSLRQLRCGDVVDAGRRVRRYEFAQESFDVDFSPSGWRFESARALPSFPRGHWLEGFVPSGSMVVFDLADSRTLWVPCLELYSRCYGASQEVNRVLATYGWAEAEERLLPSPGRPTTPERPVVRIVPPFVEADAFFLATLRYSPHTQRAAREIYSQLDEAVPSQAASGVFLKVRPWFAASAQLLVDGEWLPERGAFLAHRIAGASLPPGPVPHIVRERDGPAGAAPDPSSLEPAPPLSRRHAVSDPVELTADQPPGRDAGHVELSDDAFIVLGSPRPVTVEFEPRPSRERRFPPGHAPVPAQYAAGDATGHDHGVGQVRIHAPVQHGCEGLLLGVWNALRALQHRAADLESVEWYTFERGFRSGDPPELLRFRPYPLPKPGRRGWVWLDSDPRRPRRLRGMLALRCVLAGRPAYVLEIQRRSDESGGETESFRGFVFSLRSERDLDRWLRRLLVDLRGAGGVFRSFVPRCPGRAEVFDHRGPSLLTPSEAGVRNALSKMRGFL